MSTLKKGNIPRVVLFLEPKSLNNGVLTCANIVQRSKKKITIDLFECIHYITTHDVPQKNMRGTSEREHFYIKLRRRNRTQIKSQNPNELNHVILYSDVEKFYVYFLDFGGGDKGIRKRERWLVKLLISGKKMLPDPILKPRIKNNPLIKCKEIGIAIDIERGVSKLIDRVFSPDEIHKEANRGIRTCFRFFRKFFGPSSLRNVVDKVSDSLLSLARLFAVYEENKEVLDAWRREYPNSYMRVVKFQNYHHLWGNGTGNEFNYRAFLKKTYARKFIEWGRLQKTLSVRTLFDYILNGCDTKTMNRILVYQLRKNGWRAKDIIKAIRIEGASKKWELERVVSRLLKIIRDEFYVRSPRANRGIENRHIEGGKHEYLRVAMLDTLVPEEVLQMIFVYIPKIRDDLNSIGTVCVTFYLVFLKSFRHVEVHHNIVYRIPLLVLHNVVSCTFVSDIKGQDLLFLRASCKRVKKFKFHLDFGYSKKTKRNFAVNYYNRDEKEVEVAGLSFSSFVGKHPIYSITELRFISLPYFDFSVRKMLPNLKFVSFESLNMLNEEQTTARGVFTKKQKLRETELALKNVDDVRLCFSMSIGSIREKSLLLNYAKFIFKSLELMKLLSSTDLRMLNGSTESKLLRDFDIRLKKLVLNVHVEGLGSSIDPRSILKYYLNLKCFRTNKYFEMLELHIYSRAKIESCTMSRIDLLKDGIYSYFQSSLKNMDIVGCKIVIDRLCASSKSSHLFTLHVDKETECVLHITCNFKEVFGL